MDKFPLTKYEYKKLMRSLKEVLLETALGDMDRNDAIQFAIECVKLQVRIVKEPSLIK